jgi:hypothetical protein
MTEVIEQGLKFLFFVGLSRVIGGPILLIGGLFDSIRDGNCLDDRCATVTILLALNSKFNGKNIWLFRYLISASIPVHFQPIPHESSSYSRG